jgi:hypothetical protein
MGTQTPASSHRDALDGGGEIVEYRSLSVLAVVSLILGLLSPLVLLAPLMLAVALFGAASALVALGRIAASDGMLAGRGAALVGLALCVASMGAMGSRAVVTRQLVLRQANALANEWIEALTTGHPERALALTLESVAVRSAGQPQLASEPHAHDHDHDHDHEHEHEPSPLEQFQTNPLVKSLIAAGPQARVHPDGPTTIVLEARGVQTVERVYKVTPGGNGRPPIAVRLILKRAKNEGEDHLHWLIIDFRPAE